MRFDVYLKNEHGDLGLSSEFKKNTSQWIKEMGDFRLWRGTDKTIKGIEKLTARTDRKPRDVPKVVHDWFDDALNKKFGWKVRSSGVFCGSLPSMAQMYGHGRAYLVYPVNGYKYVWSKYVTDFFDELQSVNIISGSNSPTCDWTTGGFWDDKKELDKLTKGIVNGYTDKNLTKSNNYSAEVILHCPNGYYLIDKQYYREYIENKIKGGKL